MHACPRPHGLLCPALADVNTRIRQLMAQPATRDRAAAYRELLDEWGTLTRDDVEPAA